MNEDGKGIPIYLDEKDRPLIDALSEDDTKPRLYPSSPATQKLHHCVEAMRDLIPAIESVAECKAADKRRRRLKQVFTPLYCFVESLLHLMHDIQCNPNTKKDAPPGTDAKVAEMEKLLGDCVPHKHGQVLRQIRNKMSSHVDRSLDPMAARELFGKATPSDIGKWLDACVTVLFDLIKLPIYTWTCTTDRADVFGLTAIGMPSMLMFYQTENSHLKAIVDSVLMKRNPKREVFDLMKELLTVSRWMFKPSDPQIRGFKKDGSHDSWAQSIFTLKEMNRPPPDSPRPAGRHPPTGESITAK